MKHVLVLDRECLTLSDAELSWIVREAARMQKDKIECQRPEWLPGEDPDDYDLRLFRAARDKAKTMSLSNCLSVLLSLPRGQAEDIGLAPLPLPALRSSVEDVIYAGLSQHFKEERLERGV